MSNGWAKRKADMKQDRMDTARSLQALRNEQFQSTLGYKTKRIKDTERPATAARRERKFLFGKWDPTKGVSECCFMIRAANGTCTGCGEIEPGVELLMDSTVCEGMAI